MKLENEFYVVSCAEIDNGRILAIFKDKQEAIKTCDAFSEERNSYNFEGEKEQTYNFEVCYFKNGFINEEEYIDSSEYRVYASSFEKSKPDKYDLERKKYYLELYREIW